MTAAEQVGRDRFKNSFSPIVPFVEDVIDEARAASSFERIAKAIPEMSRRSGIARVSGTARWVLAADGLVDRASEFPKGFYIHSTDADHNQGKYIFRFPLGVFTFKREPHEEKKGLYLQETLAILKERVPLRPDFEAFAGLKVYISVPPKGSASVIVERPDAAPMTFLLDEFAALDKVVTSASKPIAAATVRSKGLGDSKQETGAESD